MSASDRAVANAIPLEIKKDAMRQTQNGDWKITFTVQAADMDQRLTSAAMGTRFQAALVEVDDNEQPKEQPKKQRLDWQEVQPHAQTSIRCAERRFRDYLAVEYGFDGDSADDALELVKCICEIKSRKEFATNPKARAVWNDLDRQYRDWAHL
jgi:hypothetical protein